MLRRVKKRSWVCDDAGGRLVLRGTNVSGAAKYRPGHLPPADEGTFARLRDEIGASAVRLLVFWEALEPERGRYDEIYLEGVTGLVDAAGRAGLRVVVDMHQDLWGRGFGSAGAPEWTVDGALYARFRPEPRAWFLGYFRPSVAQAFDRLWHDDALQTAFAAAWRRLALALRERDAVVAYDVLNEPFWGTAGPDRFDRHLAPRFYGRVVDAIREVDRKRWIALEPSPAANAGYPSRFVPPPGERLIFAPHFYPAAMELGLGYAGSARGPAALAAQLDRLAGTAARTGLPWLVGEVGARRDVAGAAAFLSDAYDLLDAHMIGGFQWELGPSGEAGYGLWDRDGSPTALARAVARPCPVRVAGEPLSWRWDRASGTFELRWIEDGTAEGDTVVALPTLAFPQGADAELEDGGELFRDGTRLYVPPRGGERCLSLLAR